MPEFATPEPICATLEFELGNVAIVAGKRATTVVEVRPSDPGREGDVRTAEQTTVTCSGGLLMVKAPRKRSLFGRSGSIDVRVELPTGSDVRSTTQVADIGCEGPLGDCRFKTSVGGITIGSARSVQVRTEHGEIRVEHTSGDAEATGAGRIDLGTIGGAATVKNLNGDIAVGEVTGRLHANSANGAISIGIAHSGVDAKSANGAIRIGEVGSGRVLVQTAAGSIGIGIGPAAAAWLDVDTRFGRVRNTLGAGAAPTAGEDTVEVHARTGLGDIDIHRV